MIESLMLIALGFFVATLFAVIAAQFVWRRAVTVTRRSLEESGTADDARVRELDDLMQRHRRETAPLEAEIQRLRAETGSLAASNDEIAREKDEIAREIEILSNENNNLRTEIEKLTAEAAGLRAHIDEGAANASQFIAAVRRELTALEAAIGSKPEPAPAQAPASVPVAAAQDANREEVEEPAGPQVADPGIDEAEAARTLAEVKASLARLDAAAEEPRPAATADAHLAETHAGDKALLARIRALEAGVAN